MEDSLVEEEVGLLQLTPEVLPALARTFEVSLSGSSMSALAENVLYGDALDRQQLDIVRLQHQLEGAAAEGAGREEDVLVVPFLRRLQWARLLGLLSGDTLEGWAQQVQQQRQQYRSLRQQQQLSASQLASLDPQRFHPLAATAGNPWSQRQADEELLEEIWRDIERTYPERDIFNKEGTRRSLQRILFAWAKSNTDVSYKQGMNEILAVLYLVCSREALVSSPSEGGASGAPFFQIFSSDPADIEADAFRLFDALMTSCCMRSMYLPPQQGKPPPLSDDLLGGPLGAPLGAPQAPPRGPPQSAVLLRCSRVFNALLAKADPAVYVHLEELGVEPQLFLLRWLRLLFCREFHVEDTLLIWDALFSDAWLSAQGKTAAAATATGAATAGAKAAAAATATGAAAAGGGGAKAAAGAATPQQLAEAASSRLPLVDFFAVAMLKFIRQHLLESELSSCLRRLLKFPPIESVQCLVALSLAVRKGGCISPSPLAAAAASSSSSSRNSSSRNSSSRSPAARETVRASVGIPRFVQQVPPLTPSVIVGTPQLQQEDSPQQQQQQQQRQRDTFKRQEYRVESLSRGQGNADAPDKPEGSETGGLLGGHIDAMRQALASVAGECNDLSSGAARLLSSVSSDLEALKAVLGGAPYSASLFKLPGAPLRTPTQAEGGPCGFPSPFAAVHRKTEGYREGGAANGGGNSPSSSGVCSTPKPQERPPAVFLP